MWCDALKWCALLLYNYPKQINVYIANHGGHIELCLVNSLHLLIDFWTIEKNGIVLSVIRKIDENGVALIMEHPVRTEQLFRSNNFFMNPYLIITK